MKKVLSNKRHQEAREILQRLVLQYDRNSLATDPVFFVHRYREPRDQEVVAFISALLAFGQVKSIHGSLEKILTILGPHPYDFISSFNSNRERERFQNLVHRWVSGKDLILLMMTLKEILERYGSLKSLFLNPVAQEIGPLLEAFSSSCLQLAQMTGYPLSRGFRYFFPRPSAGSPCKRLNMFLRWMVRPADGIDLGLWKELSPSRLIIPLDTHIFRFAQKFRLSNYKTPNWKCAEQLTQFLSTIDPEDPVRFDFSICHYGMEQGW